MKLWRALSFVVVFCMDVRVHATEIKACAQKTFPCVVSSELTTHQWVQPKIQIKVGNESLAEVSGVHNLRFVKGEMLVRAEESLQIKTPFAEFKCGSECVGIFERDSEHVRLKVLGGHWQVRPTGEKQEYAVATGLQVIVREVGVNGVALMEWPQSLPWASTIRQWGRLFTGEPKEFKQQVDEFHEVWNQAVSAASDLHAIRVKREMASIAADEAQAKASQKAREKEDESLKKLFREKNNFPQ